LLCEDGAGLWQHRKVTKNRRKVLIVSCSLNGGSRSHRLAVAAETVLNDCDCGATLVDLRHYDLPMCDGETTYDAPAARELAKVISDSDVILLAAPIYNYDLNAAAKNLVELTGSAWRDKVVGFLCAAGGRGSYMSPLGMANSLMLEYRCVIVPRFVYAIGEDFRDDGELSDKIRDRIGQLCAEATKLANGLAG
jgi:FMN reductase